jgi:hypothetical protein
VPFLSCWQEKVFSKNVYIPGCDEKVSSFRPVSHIITNDVKVTMSGIKKLLTGKTVLQIKANKYYKKLKLIK